MSNFFDSNYDETMFYFVFWCFETLKAVLGVTGRVFRNAEIGVSKH